MPSMYSLLCLRGSIVLYDIVAGYVAPLERLTVNSQPPVIGLLSGDTSRTDMSCSASLYDLALRD